jgi:hypothetical protein
VRRYIKNAALDQQVRHLGTQYGWYVLNKGAKVPNVDETVPSGYNYLVTIESPSPSILAAALKRAGRVAARNFSEIKIATGKHALPVATQTIYIFTYSPKQNHT